MVWVAIALAFAVCIVAISNRRGRAVPETATRKRTAMHDVLSADAGVAAMKVERMYVVAAAVAVAIVVGFSETISTLAIETYSRSE
jgi:hypothetical protein